MHLAMKILDESGFDSLYQYLMTEVELGYIKTQTCGNFQLFDYTRSAQFESVWNDYTIMSRGLILDVAKKKIAAMPFVKFWNYGERSFEIPTGSFLASEKMDGSMGTVFWDEYNNEWQVATRGSFTSDQAIWAKDYLYKKIETGVLNKDYTYIVEIIYPENRIVVNYSGKKSLTLLAMFNNKTGEEILIVKALAKVEGFGTTKTFLYNTLDELIADVKTWDSNREGVVVRFENGYRVKIKSDEYCRVHKIVSDLSPLSVWESMMNCDDLVSIKKELPEEFWAEYDGYVNDLTCLVNSVKLMVGMYIEKLGELTHKEIGLKMQADDEGSKLYYNMVFAHKNGKYNPDEDGRVRKAIFDVIRPTGNIL